MHAEPIELRIGQLVREKGEDITRLFEYGWTDRSIANYYGSDRLTVKRVRKLLEQEEPN